MEKPEDYHSLEEMVRRAWQRIGPNYYGGLVYDVLIDNMQFAARYWFIRDCYKIDIHPFVLTATNVNKLLVVFKFNDKLGNVEVLA